MTEDQFKTVVKGLLDQHIQGYQLEIVSRKAKDISTSVVTMVALCKDKSVTPALIEDVVDYQITNDEKILFVETQKDIKELDFEVIVFESEIRYLKG